MRYLSEAIQYSFYKDRIPKMDFDTLVAYDPTPNKAYARWIVETYLKSDPAFQNAVISGYAPELTNALKAYDRYKKANVLPPKLKDIFQFSSFVSLTRYLVNSSHELVTKIGIKNADKNIKIHYKDAQHIILTPLTYEASVKYGTGTSWCTAPASNRQHYDNYASRGTLYIHRMYKEDGSFFTEEDEAKKLSNKTFLGCQAFLPKQNTRGKTECNNLLNQNIGIKAFFTGVPEGGCIELRELFGTYDLPATFIEFYATSNYEAPYIHEKELLLSIEYVISLPGVNGYIYGPPQLIAEYTFQLMTAEDAGKYLGIPVERQSNIWYPEDTGLLLLCDKADASKNQAYILAQIYFSGRYNVTNLDTPVQEGIDEYKLKLAKFTSLLPHLDFIIFQHSDLSLFDSLVDTSPLVIHSDSVSFMVFLDNRTLPIRKTESTILSFLLDNPKVIQ